MFVRSNSVPQTRAAPERCWKLTEGKYVFNRLDGSTRSIGGTLGLKEL